MTAPQPSPNPYGHEPEPQREPDGYVTPAPQDPHQWPVQGQQMQYQPYPSAPVQPYQAPTRFGPPYRPYAAPVAAVDPGRGIGIAGLVIGLMAWWVPYIGFMAPILALALGIAGFNQSRRVGIRNNVALASIIVGAVEIVLGIVMILGLVAFVAVGG